MGDWKNNLRDGHGILYGNNGARYEGGFCQGQMHGFGIGYEPGGCRIECRFNMGYIESQAAYDEYNNRYKYNECSGRYELDR